MSKFCAHCGAQVDGMKFCPGCGAKVEEEPAQRVPASTIHGSSGGMDIEKLLPLITVWGFPIIYAIAFLSNWFDLEGTKVKLYEIYGELTDFISYFNEDVLDFFGMVFIVLLLGSACLLIYKSVMAMYAFINNDSKDKAVRSASHAAVIAIVTGVAAIVMIFVIRSIIKATAEGFAAEEMVKSICKRTKFTAMPVIMIIAGIAGKVFADKSAYFVFKAEKGEPEYVSKFDSIE